MLSPVELWSIAQRGGETAVARLPVTTWRRFVAVFGVAFVASLLLFLALIVVFDPYDSGRFTNYPASGVDDYNWATSIVSRGRDREFNSAIIGSSRGLLLKPARLLPATGFRFVQLTIPGAGPREELAVLHWFIRHHQAIGAIVVVADQLWCTRDLTNPTRPEQFPYWLYADGNLGYVINTFNTESFRRIRARLQLGSAERRRSPPDGYYDFEVGRTWAFQPAIPPGYQPGPTDAREPTGRFPWIERLDVAFADVPDDARLGLLIPPAFFTELPVAGDPRGNELAECKGALRQIAKRRKGGTVIDFMVDGTLARNPENFWDATHYRSPITYQIEAAVASALRP